MSEILQQLEKVLEERKQADPDQSYVASLHQRGLNKILEKIGEESTEAILAAKDCDVSNARGEGSREEVIKETADLWFHSMVMLSHLGIDSAEVLAELQRRFGLSGLEEKAARGSSHN